MWPLLWLLFLTSRLAAGCDENACNIGISAGVGVANACAAIGGANCVFTVGAGCPAIANGCEVAGAVAATGQEACRLCGEEGEGISAEELKSLVEQVLEKEHQETSDLIRESQKVLDSVKEVNQNIMRLADQMNDVRIDPSKLINIGEPQASYADDFEQFTLFSQKFEELERGTSGLIVNNEGVEEFKRVVNDGAERTYSNLHTMMVGNSLEGQKSIFEIDTAFCSSKDYLLYVMQRLYEFASTAKAMDGGTMDPVKTENFRTTYLEIAQKHIEICGCPSKLKPDRISNLQLLVSRPPPETSG